ncbi:DNA polymerase III subunit epsilon [Thermaurantiacus sp.]
MREIVLDTETTGLDPKEGHRIVEMAAIELVERVPTGRRLHLYLNPGRPMPPEAERVHGLTDAFLADKPRFEEVADEIIAFIGLSPVVAHNAVFDWRFLAFELERAGREALPFERMIDTLEIARRRLPGLRNTLDALCQRFGIDLSRRVNHGALVDAELLAQVYVELTGGRQIGLDFAAPTPGHAPETPLRQWPARRFEVPEAELLAHLEFIRGLPSSIWARLAAAPGNEGEQPWT